MASDFSFLHQVAEPESVVTAIPSSPTFPEFVEGRFIRYSEYIETFQHLITISGSSAELLERIRDPKVFNKDQRMSLLKLFRRCVSTVIDTEKSKKVSTPNSLFIDNYGHTFKDIGLLKRQFVNLPEKDKYALTSLIGEYDDRGKQGYILTDLFFTWFEDKYESVFSIEGPRGAGKDIQLKSLFVGFDSDYPCDFVIRDVTNQNILVVGFARYDSTRGGSQSDDRTGGNNDKVMKADAFISGSDIDFKLLFLADGPGLTHRDTWEEACILDGKLNDRVRVSTLKLADQRITEDWIRS